MAEARELQSQEGFASTPAFERFLDILTQRQQHAGMSASPAVQPRSQTADLITRGTALAASLPTSQLHYVDTFAPAHSLHMNLSLNPGHNSGAVAAPLGAAATR